MEAPSQIRIGYGMDEARGHVDHDVAIGRTGFQDTYAVASLGQSQCNDTTCAARPHDDVVERFHIGFP